MMSARHAGIGCLASSNPTAMSAAAAQPPPRASFKASTAVPCAPAIAVAGAAEATAAAVATSATTTCGNGEQAAISPAPAHAAALGQAGRNMRCPARRRGQCQCCRQWHHYCHAVRWLPDRGRAREQGGCSPRAAPAARRRPAAEATNGTGAALAACRVCFRLCWCQGNAWEGPRGAPASSAPAELALDGRLRGCIALRPVVRHGWILPGRLQAARPAPARRRALSCTQAPCEPTRPSSALTRRRRRRGSAGHCGRGRARRGRLMGGRFRLFKRAFELDAAANGARAY